MVYKTIMNVDLTDPAPLSPAKIAAAMRALLLGLARLFYFPLGDRRSYLIIPFQSYLQRTFLRFERLIARHEAGTLLPPRPRPKRAPSTTPRKNPRIRFPSRKNWVVAELGHHAAGFRYALDTLLARPDSAAFIAQYSQAQRLLRPICHMLGITPACITLLPKRARKPRPTKPRPAKPRRLTRKQRQAILWYPNSEGKPMNLLPRRLPRD